ncbi:DUF4834 domain-containing protein [uncultured Flavobacterium sp.]|uniref:DUF4834 domain-containing protein n=1 Tax=uncultured Flavobacterium sp. TaxID=165435 RepID=UPI0025FFD32D|nr:DUF4834 domain-containing protein [uncultured Flavobacterium sp.]
MDTASLMGTLRVIAIIILVYYGIKIAFRLLAPVLIQQVVKKAEQNFYQQQQNMQQQYREANTAREEKPAEKKKVGEYIDFEEIE